MLSKYNAEIAVDDFYDACTIAEILIKNGNVVMLSQEESLTIIDAIWSEGHSDRNDIAFLTREELDNNYDMIIHNNEESEDYGDTY